MNTEFIIGTIIGIIGIIPVIYQAIKWVKKPNLSELMKKLVDNSLSTKAHRKILTRMNLLLLRSGKHISSEYINGFILNKRGKEAVFTDMCLQNDWEPTKKLCQMFMNADYPFIRKKYWDMKKEQQNKDETSVTISEKPEIVHVQTKGKDIVYLSELLEQRFPKSFNRLTSILKKHDVDYRLLKGTKDIWCRDYMPIQTESGKLVQFRYDPSYLKNKEWEESRSDVQEVCRQNGFNPVFSNINLDGGNVLLCSGRAIVSDRIFTENSDYTDKEQLVKELSDLLDAEVIIIPALKKKDDMTGHADGMVRFVDHDTILGNNRYEEYKYWMNGIEKVLKGKNLKYIDVPFFQVKDKNYPDSAIGIYVNYLEVNNLIVVPVFGRDEDKQAVDIIQNAFPNKTIETIDYNDVAQEGGLLNCTTWVYRQES